MRAGRLNKQIHIMQPVVSTARSTDGAPIVTWSTYLANIWANVEQQTGQEIYRDRNRWEVEETDFICRWTTHTILTDYRVRYDSADYDIKAVINVNEADRELRLITRKHR